LPYRQDWLQAEVSGSGNIPPVHVQLPPTMQKRPIGVASFKTQVAQESGTPSTADSHAERHCNSACVVHSDISDASHNSPHLSAGSKPESGRSASLVPASSAAPASRGSTSMPMPPPSISPVVPSLPQEEEESASSATATIQIVLKMSPHLRLHQHAQVTNRSPPKARVGSSRSEDRPQSA